MFMILIKCIVDYSTAVTHKKLINTPYPTYQAAKEVKRYLVYSKHCSKYSLRISVVTIPLVFINEQWWAGTLCLLTLISTVDWHRCWKVNRKVNGGK